MNSGFLGIWLRVLRDVFCCGVVFFFLEEGVYIFFLSFFLNIVTIQLQVSESLIAIGLITSNHSTVSDLGWAELTKQTLSEQPSCLAAASSMHLQNLRVPSSPQYCKNLKMLAKLHSQRKKHFSKRNA